MDWTKKGSVFIFVFLLPAVLLAPSVSGLRPVETQATQPSAYPELAREIFQELIEINTTDSIGSTTKAAEAMAARLKAAGFPPADVQVLGLHPRKGNLVARFRGSGGRKPVLLLAHLDVVEAREEDWSFDPFRFIERDGYFYGRGTSDDKAMAAIWIANLIRYKQEGFKPDRDLIVCLTADEETGNFNGVAWLLKQHRNLIDAEYCINEGGDGEIKNGKRLLMEVQASEKVYLSFRLEAKNPGGHSSLPVKDNAIYHLSEGLVRLAKYEFPVKLNDLTRTFFTQMSKIETGQVAADMKAVTQVPPAPSAVSRLAKLPYYNALMRTTCVATRLEAGHADNALPQTARAVVNCRVLPGEPLEEVRQTLIKVLANEKITVDPMSGAGAGVASPPSPLKPEIIKPIEQTTAALWPGIPVIPQMSTGASDGLYLRNVGIPTYGVSGLFMDIDDIRAHGKDERIGVKEFYEGQEFLYQLVKTLSSGK
jgi:acetylornithine deacetylase/succinyl-diaminopimelate desuccinylase-like protein